MDRDRDSPDRYTWCVPLIVTGLLALILFAAMGLWLSFTLMHMLLTLAVAGLVGWLADLLVPGQLPYGWLGAVAAGLLGGWLGAVLMGGVGPDLFGVHIIPAFLGAVLLAGLVEVAGKSALRRP